MVFHAKIAIVPMIIFIFLLVGAMVAMAVFPLIFILGEVSSSLIFFNSVAMFIVTVGFLLWYITSIKFVLTEEHLLIKGGPFKRKILYPNIIKVVPTTARFTGYQISSSDKGIELRYKTANATRTIKILPKDKLKFIAELRKRCPNAQISEF
ncbi:PH domain-containing protein [Bacillus sp. FSL W7-1321]